MRLKANRLYPYPVLYHRNSDYFSADFGFKVKPIRTKYNVELTCSFQLRESNLNDLVDQGRCKIVLHLECPRTKFREIYVVDPERMILEIKLPASKLNGNLEVNGFVVANEDIDKFYSEDFNTDYQEINFQIQNGSLLAYDDTRYVYIEKDDKDFVDVPSVVRISYHEEKHEMDVRYDFGEENLYILLNQDDYTTYLDLSGSYDRETPIYHQMIVYPALVEAIQLMQTAPEAYAHKRWYKSLAKQLAFLGYDITEEKFTNGTYLAATMAQKVLDYPLERSLKYLLEMRDSNANGTT